MSARNEYWSEAIAQALCEMDKFDLFTSEQIDELGEALAVCAEHQSLAFYTPPASDGYARQDREWRAKYEALQTEFDRYRDNSETAVKRALRLRSDANIGIGNHGEVTNYNGRSERIL